MKVFDKKARFCAFSIAFLQIIIYYHAMVRQTEKLTDYRQTARKMYSLVKSYSSDLESVINVSPVTGGEQKADSMNLADFFNMVKNIPYKKDTEPVEVLARPYIVFQNMHKGADCKKKSILMGAWAACNRKPYRFVGISKKADKSIHHVFPQIKLSGAWVNADATYPENVLGETKKTTFAEVL